jgi:putative endonuclease
MASINKNLYIWVTNNLVQRVLQHKNKTFWWFTAKYKVNKLVYFEEFSDINEAIASEKKLKNWHREWKENLIEKDNPKWIDLFDKFGTD